MTTDYDPNRNAEEVALKSNRVCIPANDYELQLDIDVSYNNHAKLIKKFASTPPGDTLLMVPITKYGLMPISAHTFDSKWRMLPQSDSFDNYSSPGHLILRSPNRYHYHVYLGLTRPLPQSERINLQFILGSDHKRETLNTKRLLESGEANILMFESHANALIVSAWRAMTSVHRSKLNFNGPLHKQ